MLLALKPLPCIAFFCLSIFLILVLAPNRACNSCSNRVQHTAYTVLELHQQEQPQQRQSPALAEAAGTCDGRRIYIHKLPPRFNSALLRRCRYGITSWLNFCPHIAHRGLGKRLLGDDQQLSRPLQQHIAGISSQKSNSSLAKRLHVASRRMLSDHDSIQDQHHQSQAASSRNGTGKALLMQALEWHRTDAYMLEVIFHHRLRQYACLTQDPDMADAFFLPYYTGLDALRYLYSAQSDKPKVAHGLKLADWLHHDAVAKEKWAKHGGEDHFLVMGRTAWDFDSIGNWGTGILHIPEYGNMTLLLIEKQPWIANQHAIPYPTSFHPQSPASLRAWTRRVRMKKRPVLFAFAGSIRPALMKGGIRDILLDQCSSSQRCELLDCKQVGCSHNPQPIMKVFLRSRFCLQPRGDTPTRRSLFDAIIAGCIPVLFHNDTAYTQYEWHLPRERQTWSVYIDEEEVRKGARVEDILMARYGRGQIKQMREVLIGLIPRLVYGAGHGRSVGLQQQQGEPDAFDVSIREVLKLVAEKKKATQESLN